MSTPSTSTRTPVQCARNEVHTAMNYADAVQGNNELTFWMMLFDGTTIDTGVTQALQGSGTRLQLPSTGSRDQPIRLMIRRSLKAKEWKFSLVSLSFSALHATRVDIAVFDLYGQLGAQHTVSGNSSSSSSSICWCRYHRCRCCSIRSHVVVPTPPTAQCSAISY